MNKRVEWIDVAKFICMMCVIITHLDCHTDFLYNLYYTFYLAGFFFCSGYCYKPMNSFKELIKKKASQLLLPWFIYSNLNILISHIGSIKEHKSLTIELLRNLLQVRNYDERLWFLVSLFVTFIPFYFLVKFINKKEENISKATVIAILLFAIKKIYSFNFPTDIFYWGSNKLPWHIDYIPTALLSMVLGYCFKIKYEKIFDKYNKKAFVIIYSLFFVFLMYVPKFLDTSSFIKYSLYDFVGHVAGLIMIVLISKNIKTNKFISFVGSNTLIYFCIHNKFATVIEYIVKKTNLYSVVITNELSSTIFSILLATVIAVIIIPFVKFINKYLYWTLGKKRSVE